MRAGPQNAHALCAAAKPRACTGYANHLQRFRVSWPVLPLGDGITRDSGGQTSPLGLFIVSAKAETRLSFHTIIY